MKEDVIINSESVEPNEYFSVLKDSIKNIDAEALQKQLDTVAEHLINAKAIGQKKLMNKLAFAHDVIVREMKLLTSGFNRFVYQHDIKNLLDKTNNIKILELERFIRVIPTDKMVILKSAKSLEIFDDFCVVFSDYSNKDHATEEDKKVIARNRDPIIFGLFIHEKSGMRAERFYFICDWEDEYCDLTFDRMIEKMADIGIKGPARDISTDHNYITELVNLTLDEINKSPGLIRVENESFWIRFKSWIVGGKK